MKIHLKCINPTKTVQKGVHLCQPCRRTHTGIYLPCPLYKAEYMFCEGTYLKAERFRSLNLNRNLIWVTAENKEIPLRKIKDDHLFNIIRLVKKWKIYGVKGELVEKYYIPCQLEFFDRRFKTCFEQMIEANYNV